MAQPLQAGTNDLKKLDAKLKSMKIQYHDKDTKFEHKDVKEIEKRGQNPEYTKNIRSGNCVDCAVVVSAEARKLGLKAEYRFENHHVVTIVYDRMGAGYRYSNCKRTGWGQ